MATYNITKGSASTPVMSVGTTNRSPVYVENVIDFAELNGDAGAAAADIVQILDIPAESIVMDAGLEVLTTITSAGCPTFDLQTGATANKWVNAHATLTAGYAVGALTSMAAHGTAGTDGGFTTGDTMDILVNTSTATAGKVRVWALMVDVSGAQENMTASDSQLDTAV